MKNAITKLSETDPPKKTETDIKTIDTKHFEDFVTNNIKAFFRKLGLSSRFLSKTSRRLASQ